MSRLPCCQREPSKRPAHEQHGIRHCLTQHACAPRRRYNLFIIPNVEWLAIVEGQLQYLNTTGLADHAVIYVVISCPALGQQYHDVNQDHGSLLVS